MSIKNKRERIILDMKEIKKSVRREGFRDTQVQESKIRKNEKYPQKIYDEAQDAIDDPIDELFDEDQD